MKSFRNSARIIVLALVLIQLALLAAGHADPFKDDAYICLRYGRNLVTGIGLVFNPGEYNEGFTTPLWTLISAVVIALRAPAVAALKVLGALAFFGLVWVTWRASVRFHESPALAPAAIASTAAIAYWSLSGLETVAFSFAVAAGLFHFVDAARGGGRGTFAGGVWFGVAVLLRPEALAWFFLLIIALGAWPWISHRLPGREGMVSSPAGRTWRSAAKSLFATAAPVLILAGAWQVFRLAYYGEWLPNTFHAKVEWEAYVLGRGIRYLARSAVTTPYGIFLLIPLITPRSWRRPEVFFPLIVAGFHTLYLILIGGDYMVFGRFVVPILAPLALAWSSALEVFGETGNVRRVPPEPDRSSRLREGDLGAKAAVGDAQSSHHGKTADCESETPPLPARKQLMPQLAKALPGTGFRRKVVPAVAVAAAFLTAIVPYFESPSVRDPDGNVARYRKAGHWIARYLEPSALVATPAIGAVGYLGGTRILDTLGIVDRYLAHYRNPAFAHLHAPAGHARGDGAYVLKRAPDIILLANVWIRPVPLVPQQVAANEATLSLTDRLLFGMPEFLKRYEILSFRLEDGDWFGMAVRRDSRYHPDNPAWTGPQPDVRSP